jgi:NADH-quinone oxidoreductase subunit A
MTGLGIVGYLMLFVAVGVGFILIHLLLGKLVRPARPDPEKQTIYECGEPTIGSSWVQFDLRFYVIALLFVVFDVEVAFFFPWAVVFGQSNTLADPLQPRENQVAAFQALTPNYPELAAKREQVITALQNGDEQQVAPLRQDAHTMAWIAFFDILVFFGVLLVGFAYLWRRGDLVWVRSTAAERFATTTAPAPPPAPAGQVLVGAGERS